MVPGQWSRVIRRGRRAPVRGAGSALPEEPPPALAARGVGRGGDRLAVQGLGQPVQTLADAGTQVRRDSVDPPEVARNRDWGITGATSYPIIVSDPVKTGRLDDQLSRFLRVGLDDEAIAWRLPDSSR